MWSISGAGCEAGCGTLGTWWGCGGWKGHGGMERWRGTVGTQDGTWWRHDVDGVMEGTWWGWGDGRDIAGMVQGT